MPKPLVVAILADFSFTISSGLCEPHKNQNEMNGADMDGRANAHTRNEQSAPLARSTAKGEGHVQGLWSQRAASLPGLIDNRTPQRH